MRDTAADPLAEFQKVIAMYRTIRLNQGGVEKLKEARES